MNQREKERCKRQLQAMTTEQLRELANMMEIDNQTESEALTLIEVELRERERLAAQVPHIETMRTT